MLHFIAFVLLSAVLAYISRGSLRAPRSHGFYRFFAWEFILGLILANLEAWFVNPGAWHQVISWVLLCLSLAPLFFGVRALRSRGKPVKERAGEENLLAFEKTSMLVTTGIYHYIRHPLYCSLLLLAGVSFLKRPAWWAWCWRWGPACFWWRPPGPMKLNVCVSSVPAMATTCKEQSVLCRLSFDE
jgi:protein-S-isoprenylcysteine O-methyltransferase Ste14